MISLQHRSAETEEKILSYIKERWNDEGAAPTMREIESALGIPKVTVCRYINAMKADGRLEADRNGSIADPSANEPTRLAPVLGSVSCGPLKLAQETHDRYVRLPVSLFGGGELFILEADGYSMKDIGIMPGDFVVVRKQSSVDDGEVAVVIAGEDATLKRVYRDYENKRIRLHPENETMEDMYVESCIILGKAVKVIKNVI